MATHTFSNRICCDILTDHYFPTSGYKLETKQYMKSHRVLKVHKAQQVALDYRENFTLPP